MRMMTNTSVKERNYYIDALKGIAAIGIVAIHTAFWSGESYTPVCFRNITLFLDVPFFFYLSGWASSYHESNIARTCRSLKGLWLKWIYFIALLAAFCAISSKILPITFGGAANLRDLIYAVFFNVNFPGFPVVGGSIWFMPIYFVVILGNTIVMLICQKSAETDMLKRTYMFLLAVSFVWLCFGGYFLGLDAKYYLFYSFFWMLGQNRVGRDASYLQLMKRILVMLIGICFSSYVFDIALLDIQSAKFPPTIKYGFVSMIAIYVAAFFDGTIKSRFLTHIGKNAIFYYFGQGVGSSLIYYFVNSFVTDLWFLKWCMAFGINVIVTVIIAELLARSYTILIQKAVLLKERVKVKV